MSPAEILRAAKAKIADRRHWCQGTSAENSVREKVRPRSEDACRWCSSGAIASLSETNLEDIHQAWRWLNDAALALGATADGANPDPFVVLNDTTNHATVLRMFDRAIALAEQKGGAGR